MNTIFNLHPYKIYEEWRNFREKLKKETKKEEILKKIHDFWWDFPFINYYIDYKNVKNWPSPWEIIYEKKCDEFGRAILMAETLLLLEKKEFDENKISIKVYKDNINHEILSILEVDDFILNFEFKKLIPIKEFINYEKKLLLIDHFTRKNNTWVNYF